MELLVIAFYLSVLTYYLGVLIQMLPIPFYGVKKWAPQLMVDSVFSAILVFSYSLIQWIIDYLGHILGVDWNAYYQWFFNEINFVISTILTLKFIGMGLSSIGLNFLANSLISPLISSLTYLLVFLITFSLFVSIIVTLSPTLIALGILLHALPFRLARSSGATILAVVIVFSIGAPLMPQFIELISSHTSLTNTINYGYVPAYITVYDLKGTPLPYYLYEIYDENNTLLARYLADEKGLVNASSLFKGVPYNRQSITISLAGYIYKTIYDPRNESISKIANITYKLDNIVSVKTLRLLAFFNEEKAVYNEATENSVSLTIDSSQNTYVVLIGLKSDDLILHVDRVQVTPNERYEYEWGGVEFKAYKYYLKPGKHIIQASFIGSDRDKPYFKEIYYARDTLKININEPLSMIYPVAILIYRLFIAPTVYFSILFSSSLALSRLLGGSSSKIAHVLVSGV
ncbi:MAG: hypothetical protein B6U89_03950 [Desulfurococcales archaeon ex4484_58]|nr:MAG: hypothetical protein B6U89_03950 [Desulfurococcales archaeon ex4484_58]